MPSKKALLSSWVEKHQVDIFKLCYFLSQNRAIAEDLTQATFLRAIEKSDQLKDRERPLPWLKSIARNLYLDHYKSASVAMEHRSIEDFEFELIEESKDLDLQLTTLSVLSQMSPEERFILILIDVQESTYEEAAGVLDCPVGTIKSRLSRARQAFADIFDEMTGTKKPLHSSVK